jgi:enoyl-[acyl-carrier-protein] reductase (NADH)
MVDLPVDGIAARTPLRRLSTPDQVAAPALFLISAANTSITGEVIREGSSTGRSTHV